MRRARPRDARGQARDRARLEGARRGGGDDRRRRQRRAGAARSPHRHRHGPDRHRGHARSVGHDPRRRQLRQHRRRRSAKDAASSTTSGRRSSTCWPATPASSSVMLVAALAGLPLPLLPLHLLWINVVTDGLPALALVMDPADDDVLARRPGIPASRCWGARSGGRSSLTGALEAPSRWACSSGRCNRDRLSKRREPCLLGAGVRASCSAPSPRAAPRARSGRSGLHEPAPAGRGRRLGAACSSGSITSRRHRCSSKSVRSRQRTWCAQSCWDWRRSRYSSCGNWRGGRAASA